MTRSLSPIMTCFQSSMCTCSVPLSSRTWPVFGRLNPRSRARLKFISELFWTCQKINYVDLLSFQLYIWFSSTFFTSVWCFLTDKNGFWPEMCSNIVSAQFFLMRPILCFMFEFCNCSNIESAYIKKHVDFLNSF